MFHGAVPWVYFTVSMVGGLCTVNAFVPVRRDPFTVASFLLAWIPGELPVQVLVVQVAGTLAFAHFGAFDRWPGQVGLAVAVASWAGLAWLAVVAHRSGRLVDEALESAGAAPLPGPVGRPVWNTWWRLAIAVPFRFRRIRRIRNVDYWGDGIFRHRLDVLRLRDHPPERGPVLVYVHGGAWMIGNKRQQGIPMLHELAARGWVCVAINYRLSPRATWPSHIVDVKRALAWVREHIAEYGGDPTFVAVSGGSAGGHLAALAALTPGAREWQPGFEDADTSVDACVPFYGAYDLTGDPEASGEFGPGLLRLLERFVMKQPIADDRERYVQASATERVGPAAPPMFVLHGINDTLVPIRVARRLVERLRAVSSAPVAFVELPRTQHAFDVLASIRCRHTTLGVVRFLEGVRAGTVGAAPAPATPAPATPAPATPAPATPEPASHPPGASPRRSADGPRRRRGVLDRPETF